MIDTIQAGRVFVSQDASAALSIAEVASLKFDSRCV
jgi:hypothetical protein